MFRKTIAGILILFIFSFIAVMPASFAATSDDTGQAADTSSYDDQTVTKIMGKTDIMSLKAKSSLLMDAVTGTVLIEYNSSERLPIASITKIMSMLLLMEAIDGSKIRYDEKVLISEHSYSMGGSQVYLEPGEEFTVKELLKAVAIHSANDATVAIAEKISGSEEYFVMQMNEKARELGMKDTNFLDCTGLTDEGHYSTAYDIAVMSRELIMKHPGITEYTSVWHDTFRDGKFSLDNTNKLVRFYEGTTGLKTGFTSKAGYCLCATAQRGDMKLIAVALGEPDSNTRFAEVRKLLDFGFANFETVMMDPKGTVIKEVKVRMGIQSTVNALLSNNAELLVRKGSSDKIMKEFIIDEYATAPINAGQKLGEAVYSLEGNELRRIPLIAGCDIKKASFFNLFVKMLLGWIGLGRDD